MTTTSIIIVGLLFIATNAQGVRQESSSTNSSGGLQPWLLGLTAMVVFLFIVFVLLIVNRVWCKKSSDTDEDDGKGEGVGVTMNVYDNNGFEKEGPEDNQKEHEGNKKAKWVQEESDETQFTPM